MLLDRGLVPYSETEFVNFKILGASHHAVLEDVTLCRCFVAAANRPYQQRDPRLSLPSPEFLPPSVMEPLAPEATAQSEVLKCS